MQIGRELTMHAKAPNSMMSFSLSWLSSCWTKKNGWWDQTERSTRRHFYGCMPMASFRVWGCQRLHRPMCLLKVVTITKIIYDKFDNIYWGNCNWFLRILCLLTSSLLAEVLMIMRWCLPSQQTKYAYCANWLSDAHLDPWTPNSLSGSWPPRTMMAS